MKEALTCKVHDAEGQEVGSIELDPQVFGVAPAPRLVHEVVRWQRRRMRSGTHATLNRARMEGGGRKPWRQKGSGRARAGTNNSPLWKGGAVIHGPQPRTYGSRVTKQARRQALTSILSHKLRNDRVRIVDGAIAQEGKTKQFVGLLKNLGVQNQGILVISQGKDEMMQRAGRNIPKVDMMPVEGLNVYDVMRKQYLVCTKDAVAGLQARFASAEQEGV